MYHADLAEKESRISKLLGDISMYSIYYQRNLSVMIDSLYPEPYTCRMGLITKAFQSISDVGKMEFMKNPVIWYDWMCWEGKLVLLLLLASMVTFFKEDM